MAHTGNHPAEALDGEQDFLIKPTSKLKWADTHGRTAMVGLSVKLHQLLHTFEPHSISQAHGPYTHVLIAAVIGRYIASRRAVLVDRNFKGICMAQNDTLGEIFAIDKFPWDQLHVHLRKHLVLLDIVD